MNIVQPAAPPLPPELITRFRGIVGDKYAVTDAADIAPYLTEERDLFHGRSPLVLRPGSTAEVSAICRLTNEHAIALVPFFVPAVEHVIEAGLALIGLTLLEEWPSGV